MTVCIQCKYHSVYELLNLKSFIVCMQVDTFHLTSLQNYLVNTLRSRLDRRLGVILKPVQEMSGKVQGGRLCVGSGNLRSGVSLFFERDVRCRKGGYDCRLQAKCIILLEFILVSGPRSQRL